MTTLQSALDLLTRIADADDAAVIQLRKIPALAAVTAPSPLTAEIRTFINECTARAPEEITVALKIDASQLRADLPIMQMVFDLAREAANALEDSESQANGDALIAEYYVTNMCLLLDKLEALPDDRPGYTLGPVAKAEWALRAPVLQELRDIAKGDTYRETTADFYTAGINVGEHFDRIECNGRTPEIAEKLRDEVYAKLIVGGVP